MRWLGHEMSGLSVSPPHVRGPSFPEGARHGENGGKGQHVSDEAHCADEEHREALEREERKTTRGIMLI